MKTAALAFALVAPVAAQDVARQVWDTFFTPARQQQPQASTAKPAPAPRYRTTISPAPGASKPASALGVTVWKAEPSKAGDNARLLVLNAGKEQALTPHRLESGEPLRENDLVRLSIESPRGGYLYIVDQELFEGHRTGEPFLIFPQKGTSGGNNRIRPGQLLEVPAQTDPKPFFTVTRSGGSVGELISIIATEAPIPGLTLADKETKLPAQLFDSWKKQYGGQTQTLELQGGSGRAWTVAEKQAGGSRDILLTTADAPPQTVYAFPERAARGMLVSVALRVQ